MRIKTITERMCGTSEVKIMEEG